MNEYVEGNNARLPTALCNHPFRVLAGPQSETDPEVCGLVVSLRKGQHRIALWTKTCEESRVVPAGKKLKEALKVRGGYCSFLLPPVELTFSCSGARGEGGGREQRGAIRMHAFAFRGGN